MEERLLSEPLTPDLLRAAKRLGFGDEQIANLAGSVTEKVRQQRLEWGIRPVYKMVDTCAAEFAAATPYFYSTYEEENEALPQPGDRALVVGSGPIRIGQGIEFDYASVKAAQALRAAGYAAIMANSNPETVSTDFDTSDRLYFEPLDEESALDMLENEAGAGGGADGEREAVPSILQFGGQTAINLAGPLTASAQPILGSSAEAIDLAEDRKRFERFLTGLGIPQPPGTTVSNMADAIQAAATIGYPVLVRPSYVLGGRAMEIVQGAGELARYVGQAMEAGPGRPVLIDKYFAGIEVEVDAICDGESVLIPGIMEHIERAGVHSGDSMAVYPAPNLTAAETDLLVDYTRQIGLGLDVRGLMNIQYVVMRGRGDDPGGVFVLEVNPRASRTVPFLSKVTTVPMVELAVNVMLGRSLREQGYADGLWPSRDLVAIKAPVFSMSKLAGVDTYLGPEMKSTGEVMGVDRDFDGALTKALLASDLALPARGTALLSIADQDKAEAIDLIRQLGEAGYTLYATDGTAEMIRGLGLEARRVPKRLAESHPNVVDVIEAGEVDFVLNTSEGGGRRCATASTSGGRRRRSGCPASRASTRRGTRSRRCCRTGRTRSRRCLNIRGRNTRAPSTRGRDGAAGRGGGAGDRGDLPGHVRHLVRGRGRLPGGAAGPVRDGAAGRGDGPLPAARVLLLPLPRARRRAAVRAALHGHRRGDGADGVAAGGRGVAHDGPAGARLRGAQGRAQPAAGGGRGGGRAAGRAGRRAAGPRSHAGAVRRARGRRRACSRPSCCRPRSSTPSRRRTGGWAVAGW